MDTSSTIDDSGTKSNKTETDGEQNDDKNNPEGKHSAIRGLPPGVFGTESNTSSYNLGDRSGHVFNTLPQNKRSNQHFGDSHGGSYDHYTRDNDFGYHRNAGRGYNHYHNQQSYRQNFRQYNNRGRGPNFYQYKRQERKFFHPRGGTGESKCISPGIEERTRYLIPLRLKCRFSHTEQKKIAWYCFANALTYFINLQTANAFREIIEQNKNVNDMMSFLQAIHDSHVLYGYKISKWQWDDMDTPTQIDISTWYSTWPTLHICNNNDQDGVAVLGDNVFFPGALSSCQLHEEGVLSLLKEKLKRTYKVYTLALKISDNHPNTF